MKKIILFLTVFVLLFSLTVPTFAADNDVVMYDNGQHAGHFVQWSYEGTTYGLNVAYEYQSDKYKHFSNVPLYLSWDDELVFIVDPADLGGKVPYLHTCTSTSSLSHTCLDNYNFIAVTDNSGNVIRYQCRVPTNTELYGLSFSTMSSFANGLSSSNASLYYLETLDSDWSTAVNFSTPSMGALAAMKEVMAAQTPSLGAAIMGMARAVIPIAIGILALLIGLNLVPKVLARFLN